MLPDLPMLAAKLYRREQMPLDGAIIFIYAVVARL
jgi:hypothetical protein